jgi:CheY-like chemotaxis protein
MKTILIVDDERHMLCLLQSILRKTGCRLLGAASGEEALRAAAETPVDLALVDVGLPGIDGFETGRRLRGMPGGAGLPIIVLTARGQEHVRRSAEATHATLFLTKPFSPLELRAQVASLLGLPVVTA